MNGRAGAPVIRVLDQATVNQIAAGEVVERPASVVKELTENAIDAGARSIRIDLTSSPTGISSVRVTDDGSGMSPADAIMAFTPHATSKITAITDLDRISTLGFRGEALASIAAVSRVTLITRPRDNPGEPGTKIVITGGVIAANIPIGAPEGTSILVEDLFFNTPARKKFQKSRNTELAHIHGLLEGIVLAHPSIAFRLYHNGVEKLLTDRDGTLPDAIARVYGPELARDLIPVSAQGPLVQVSGYISLPAQSRRDHSRIRIAINKRYVSSPAIINAIKEGYGTLLPKDRFPVAFLSITVDPAMVDVNVHPTKKLVRISREPEIMLAIRHGIHTVLFQANLMPDAGSPTQELLPEYHEETAVQQPDPGEYRIPDIQPGIVSEPTHAGGIMTDRQLRRTEPDTGVPPVTPRIPPLQVIGQFGGIYILATTDTGELVVIDQHAAHERILYEIVSNHGQDDQVLQELIVPVVLHRTPRESALLRELLPALSREGFVMEDFGRDTFLVRAIPVFLGKPEDLGMIDEIISDLTSPESGQRVDNRERITRVIACRGAVKAGTVCSQEQCQRVADQLRQAKNPFTCPHGRPTLIRFSKEDLDGMFKRT
ncbi:DNA mismatch repair endonuclease MutL [Methanoregula sp.]|uniref:DNA mismatch repair endonuclease MutL n=1 Tax=Methanoregula sp. TaxID=2052170 RepID=UPI003C765E7C